MHQDDLIPCVFQIPLTYGDSGAEVEPELMLRIHQAIIRQFGGFTPLARIHDGKWVDESADGKVVTEDQLRVEVCVPRSRVPVLRRLVQSVGFETRQKQMFLIIPEARVNRFDIQDSNAGGLAL
jgi:hypothetical protein